MQKNGHKDNENRVLEYCHLVVKNKEVIITPDYQKKVAYATILIGHIARNNKKFDMTETCYSNALAIYESIEARDEQYIRLKNTLAQVVAQQSGREKDANKIFLEVSEYWNKLDFSRNHYAANHFMAYSKFCAKSGSFDRAAELIEKVIRIYKLRHNGDHKEYFAFSDLPQIAKEIYTNLSKTEQDKHELLNSYVSTLRKPEENTFNLWHRRKEPTSTIVIEAIRPRPE